MRSESRRLSALEFVNQKWRTDSDTARTIDYRSGVQAYMGTFYAALLLHTKGVDINIALYVLTRNRHQRGDYLYHTTHGSMAKSGVISATIMPADDDTAVF